MKFKVGDDVIFKHMSDKDHYRNNVRHFVVAIFKRPLSEYGYKIQSKLLLGDYIVYENELVLYNKPKNHLPKWW